MPGESSAKGAGKMLNEEERGVSCSMGLCKKYISANVSIMPQKMRQ
jgi:hypothetical protein